MSSIKLLILLLVGIQLINADQCIYKQDGSGLLNSIHQLYYDDQCYPCLPQCKSCISVKDTTCSDGNCQDYYYYNLSVNQCQKCSSLCKKCKGPLQSDCQLCLEGFYFDQLNKVCKNCPFGASQCIGMSINSCFDQFFLDSQTFTCRKCSSNCDKCLSSSSCSSCQQGYFLTNNVCSRCLTTNCAKCVDQNTCYQCLDGFNLISSNQCVNFSCTQLNCKTCFNNGSLCTQCNQKYYLFGNKCYFGSSLLCLNGINGASYGRCNSCLQQLSYKNQLAPTFCLLTKPATKQIQYQFKGFSQYFICQRPLFMTKGGSKSVQYLITSDPFFLIDIQIRVISSASSNSINIFLSNDKELGQYTNLNKTTYKYSPFYCQIKSSEVNNTLFIHRIYNQFYVSSLSKYINLTIQGVNKTDSIYLSQILIKKQMCQVSNCQACYSTNLCSSCIQKYLLQQYQCKIACSPGFYSNFYQRKCVYDCGGGYFINFQQSKCQKCPSSCKQCKNYSVCKSCSNSYYLYQSVCLNYCPSNTTYPSNQTNKCNTCKNPCKTCLNNGSNCTSCLSGYLFQNKCIQSCPLTYFQYFQNFSSFCQQCSSQCNSCTLKADYCTSCRQPLNLFNGKCIQTCPQKYYQTKLSILNIKNYTCQPCKSFCKSCQNHQMNCSGCLRGFYLSLSLDQFLSINQTIFNEETSVLFEIFQASGNVSVYLNSSIKSGVCITKCPKYYYFENQTLNQCIKCSQNCIKCLNLQTCLECGQNYFVQNSLCVQKCQKPYLYMDLKTKTCKKCKMPCLECLNDYQGNKCTACLEGYTEFNQIQPNNTLSLNNSSTNYSQVQVKCLMRCPTGYFKNTSSQKVRCSKCPSQCTSCFSQNKCSGCIQGYILTQSNQCIAMDSYNCTSGFFLNKTQLICKKCSSFCNQCTDYQDLCTSCTQKLYIQLDLGICVEQCQAGYYPKIQYMIDLNSSSNNSQVTSISLQKRSCQKCKQNCSQCVSLTNCSKCKQEFNLLLGQCLSICPTSYYQYFDSNGKSCQLCSPNCITCSSARICLQCDDLTYLIQNECYSNCFQGFYFLKSINQLQNKTLYQCLKCPQQCQTCMNLENCTSCYSGYFLEINQTSQNGKCTILCSQLKYANYISLKCQSCKYPCKTCKNNLVCLSCQDNLTLVNQDCVTECPQNFFLSKFIINNTYICLKCPSQCLKCPSQFQCLSCKQGYYLNDISKTCVQDCPSKYFQNTFNSKCQQCQKPCQNCILNKNQCQTCINGYYLRNQLCLSVCPTGTYAIVNETRITCTDCPANCKVCQNSKNCTLCQNRMFLTLIRNDLGQISQQACSSSCINGTYADFQSKKCQLCYEKCKNCIENKFKCTQCYSNEYLLKNICVQNCPLYYFQNKLSFTCDRCGKWCQSCLSQKVCTKCASEYLHLDLCIAECPLGYYPNKQKGICSECMKGCTKCKNEHVCLVCDQNENYVLYGSNCINLPCPNNNFHMIDTNQCIETCPYLTNKRNKQCYQFKCPTLMILSSTKKQCVQFCNTNEFVHYQQDLYNNYTCKASSYLSTLGISQNNLPQFSLQIVPFGNYLEVIVLFSFDVFNEFNNAFQQEYQKIKFSLQVLKDQFQTSNANTILSNSLLSSSNSFSTDEGLKLKNRLLASSNNQNYLSFQITQSKTLKNAVYFKLSLNQQSNPNPLKQIDSTLQLTAKLTNSYEQFNININSHKIPIQKSIDYTTFNYINYTQKKSDKLAISLIIWILISISIMSILIEFYLMKKQVKLYLFGSTIQFFQNMYFLCFLPINLPSVLENLFYAFRFTSGDLIIAEILKSFAVTSSNEEIVISPWQFYKYSDDINLFKNLADVITILGFLCILVGSAKLITKFTGILLNFTRLINQNKKFLFQLFVWTFSSTIGLYGLINTFFTYNKPQYLSSLQKSIPYKLLNYLITILYFLTPLYFFYHQYMNKTKFDKGLNKQKKKLGVSIPLYRYLRRFLFIFFITYYYNNPIHAVCIFLMSTATIFIMIFWYQPYKNTFRQIVSVIQQGSLFILFSQILIFVLNPNYYQWISWFILIHTILHIVLLLIYPFYCSYQFIKYDKQVELTQEDQSPSEIQQKWIQKQKNQNQQIGKEFVAVQEENNNSVSTKLNFGRFTRNNVMTLNNQEQISAHEADQSDQGQVTKKKVVNNVIRLAKKQTKKARQFKNYAFSSDQEEQQQQISQDLNKNKMNGSKQVDKHQSSPGKKIRKYQF